MHEPSLINALGAFFFFFAPYFLLFKIMQWTGGFAGKVAGIAGEAGKKVDFSRNFRKKERADRGKRFKEGTLFNPDSAATKWLGGRAVNRIGSHVGATQGSGGWRMGFGDVGQAKRANMAFVDSGTFAKDNRDFAAQINNEEAMAALAFGNNEAALRRLTHFKLKNPDGTVKQDTAGNDIVDEAKLQRALAAGMTIRVTSQSKTAAADALAKSGKIIENRAEAEQLYSAVSGNNAALHGAVKGATQYTWRQVGRNDVGRDSNYESLQEMSMQQLSSLKPIAAKNLAPIIPDVIAGGVDSRGNPLSGAEKQHFVDLLYAGQFNPYTNAYQQDAISKGVAGVSPEDWARAGENYRSKMGGAGGMSGDPGQRMPYGPILPTAPQQPYEPPRDSSGGHQGYM